MLGWSASRARQKSTYLLFAISCWKLRLRGNTGAKSFRIGPRECLLSGMCAFALRPLRVEDRPDLPGADLVGHSGLRVQIALSRACTSAGIFYGVLRYRITYGYEP